MQLTGSAFRDKFSYDRLFLLQKMQILHFNTANFYNI